MERDPQQEPNGEETGGRRPSWPYPAIIVAYLVLILITPAIGGMVGMILLGGVMGVCVWAALSPSQFRQMQAGYPDLERSEYILNMLFFPVIVPLLLFGGWLLWRY